MPRDFLHLILRKTAENIRKKIDLYDVVITKADKGNTIIALNRDNYVSKTLSFLNTNTIQLTHDNPTEIYQETVKSFIKNSHTFNSFNKYEPYSMNPQPPKLYYQTSQGKLSYSTCRLTY